MKKACLMLALGTGLLALAGPLWGAVSHTPPTAYSVAEEVFPARTLLHFSPPPPVPGAVAVTEPRQLHQLVALPPSATRCSVTLLAGDEVAQLVGEPRIQRLRGQPVVAVQLTVSGQAPISVEIEHDGDRHTLAGNDTRLQSVAFGVALGGPALEGPMVANESDGGSYVIITTDDYTDAVTPLADWKRRKGFPVVVATTGETGSANTDIKAWLQNAYDTWEEPPEYVLLVGDVADVPTWTFSGNVSDHPYACLDGDDWLPDVFVGRFPVESPYQARTVVAKSMAYERTPYLDQGEEWFTRSLMVAGNSGSTTPMSTVVWCGEQLESIGFEPPAGVFYAPPWFPNWDGSAEITAELESGVSMVVYRGWAYGIQGWQPPEFTVAHIPGVQNGAMDPVVMSFVCHTGDFGHAESCFGEVFLRQGSPTAAKGAVAFIGNGEHWSTTRFNDAMAYSFFQRITDPEISDLGRLMTAGKLQFMTMFPLEYDAGHYGEASVEFYFHIYNLLGDPELNYWRAAPRELTVTHTASVQPGANYLEVTVEDDDASVLAGARIGVVRNNVLLGHGFTATDGVARLALSSVPAGSDLAITVTHPDRVPYEGTIAVGDGSGAFLATADTSIDDDAVAPSDGNGDGLLNPGETVEISVSLANHGSGAATGVSATLSVDGPASTPAQDVGFPDVPAGGNSAGDEPYQLTVDAAASDAERIFCQLTVVHDGSAGDVSRLDFTVSAPELTAGVVAMDGDGFADPGEEVIFYLDLQNSGSAGTAGGTATISLVNDEAGTVSDATAAFDAIASGAAVTTSDPIGLTVAAGTAVGTSLVFSAVFTTGEGYELSTSFSFVVGQMDIGAPAGPDTHGYYAYDSADINYPGQVPVYRWTELSPTFGGTGDEIVFYVDTYLPVIELPFTFRFYGQPVDSIRVSDNGWISFDTAEGYDWWNLPLPHPYGNHSIVAPFWDNFDPTEPETDGVYSAYDATAATFTVQWTRMRRDNALLPDLEDLETFQVVLRNPAVHSTLTGDGEILFLYKQVSNSDVLFSYASAGIEDEDEEDGLQLTYSNVYAPGCAPLSPGLAVRFTTDPPEFVRFHLASFQTQRQESGVLLQWAIGDERPLHGWQVYRLEDEGPQLLTATPLPATARSYLDSAADAGSEAVYQLTALHPWDQKSRLGPFSYAPSSSGDLRFSLLPCWPNPVLGSTDIHFALPRNGLARLRIFDLAGRCVRTLLNGTTPAGPTVLTWDGRDNSGRLAAGGVYLYRLETDAVTWTRKLLLVR